MRTTDEHIIAIVSQGAHPWSTTIQPGRSIRHVLPRTAVFEVLCQCAVRRIIDQLTGGRLSLSTPESRLAVSNGRGPTL